MIRNYLCIRNTRLPKSCTVLKSHHIKFGWPCSCHWFLRYHIVTVFMPTPMDITKNSVMAIARMSQWIVYMKWKSVVTPNDALNGLRNRYQSIKHALQTRSGYLTVEVVCEHFLSWGSAFGSFADTPSLPLPSTMVLWPRQSMDTLYLPAPPSCTCSCALRPPSTGPVFSFLSLSHSALFPLPQAFSLSLICLQKHTSENFAQLKKICQSLDCLDITPRCCHQTSYWQSLGHYWRTMRVDNPEISRAKSPEYPLNKLELRLSKSRIDRSWLTE